MKAKILSPHPENIALAALALQNGDLVGMPTETVYGLAGDCRNPLAMARIFEAKERPTFDPLIVHVGLQGKGIQNLNHLQLIDSSQMSDDQINTANLLIKNFWPGPLTLILPKHKEIPDLVTSGSPFVGLRMPNHPLAQALIAASQTALAAPSANRFGRISPTTSQAVFEELGDRIPWILEGGPCHLGVESTIVSFARDGSSPEILRQGGVPQEDLEKVLGRTLNSGSKVSTIPSPGTLESHYAPRKELLILPKTVNELNSSDLTSAFLNTLSRVKAHSPSPNSKLGLLLLSGEPVAAALKVSGMIQIPVWARSLSLTGDLREVARNLFAEMRSLDASDVSLILSEPCLASHGLGFAIADRLKRASAPRPLL